MISFSIGSQLGYTEYTYVGKHTFSTFEVVVCFIERSLVNFLACLRISARFGLAGEGRAVPEVEGLNCRL